MPQAPGVTVTVSAAPPSPNGNAPTGTWFVTGETQQGPTGIPIPITSMTDYANYLGTRVSYGFLYDALNEFFSDGGVLAYVSRIVGPGAVAASVTLQDRAGSPLNTLSVRAAGAGSWGNNLSVVVAGSASNSYTISVVYSGTTVVTSPNLFTPADAVNWFASQNSWQSLVTVTNLGSATAAPNNNPATGTFALTSGSDDTADVSETQWTNALTAFTDQYGPGQVSAPGHTTSAGYQALNNHANNFNRFAILDVADSASASALIAEIAGANFQTEVTDPSYSAIYAPWVIIPGIFSTNPGSSSPVPSRTIPPSAVAAAAAARNDQVADANVATAGPNGISVYATGLTQVYSQSDLGNLNAAGINVLKVINGAVTIYGNRSLALDPNWVFASNCRFRMQVVYDFDLIGDNFVFAEIDGKGQLFARFNGALAGQCQTWWMNGSIYGATGTQAFQVNTGPQVNTPATIAAGQINAEVLLRMSPAGELVNITVVKYSAAVSLPVTAA